MKRVLTMLALAVTSVMMSVMLVFAESGGAGQQGKTGEKYTCLLATKLVVDNCPNQLDSINGKIERLNGEIAKGVAVYTSEELGILRTERDEFLKLRDYVNNHNSSYVF